jgi:CDP-glucose 4,6-dehydratase
VTKIIWKVYGIAKIYLGKLGNMKKISSFDYFKNKTVLVTGHTGFIGTWLSLWLTFLGANVVGYSLNPLTTPSLFDTIQLKKNINHIHGDIRDFKKLKKTIEKNKPEFIFHLAAQAIVRESYNEPLLTFDTNVIGTANVLESIKNSSVKSCIIMTSDKCYDNKEIGRAFKESDPMGGDDPYSASKGAAELVTSAYRNSFFKNSKVGIASVRSGNVIGGGDWSVDRLMPDCFRHISKNKMIPIRNPGAVRPWQFVLEPVSGMMSLALHLRKNPLQYSEPWNFGPNSKKHMTVEQMVKKIIKQWGKGNYKINSNKKNKTYAEAKILILNSIKAKKFLNWSSLYSNNESLFETIEWYKEYSKNNNMKTFSIMQIQKYMNKMNGVIDKK